MYHCYTRLGNFSVTICGTVSLLHQIWQLENNLLKICSSLCETVSPVTPNFKNGKMFWKTCWHENFCVTIFDDVSLLHQTWLFFFNYLWHCSTVTPDLKTTNTFSKFVTPFMRLYHKLHLTWKVLCTHLWWCITVTPDLVNNL